MTRTRAATGGNAALAAAVIARARERSLDIFIPADTNPRVVAALSRLGATIHVCVRVSV
ncbi:hypothetical protein [Sorangium sp. So ce1335]|uniref:hypothetical protein n=1 Tax=Sorangium sp. So ce1335 TaxID=3133335 RepID=UPI003F637BBC